MRITLLISHRRALAETTHTHTHSSPSKGKQTHKKEHSNTTFGELDTEEARIVLCAGRVLLYYIMCDTITTLPRLGLTRAARELEDSSAAVEIIINTIGRGGECCMARSIFQKCARSEGGLNK